MGSGAGDLTLTVARPRVERLAAESGSEQIRRTMGRTGEGVKSGIYSEVREERTEVCKAKSCSAEAREAVRVLNGGRRDGIFCCL